MADSGVACAVPEMELLKGKTFPPVSQTYGERDCILYALGLGIGNDPCNVEQLRFVQGSRISVLPTMAAVLASPGEWMRDPSLGIKWERLVALSHHLDIFRPIPSAGTVHSLVKITDVFDRGQARGALIRWQRELIDTSTQECLAILSGQALARDNGGFGGRAAPVVVRDTEPDGPPQIRFRWTTLEMQALLYRLSGDLNPLHSDPGVAKAAGFEKPILHGLCSLGVACFAIVSTVCQGDTAAIKQISARYTGVVYPGETLEVQIWNDGPNVRFRCRVEERDSVVLNGGTVQRLVLQ
ncbi:MaoC/PaaZ C-terminal domain-containing protein [Ottowia thiooxydans]|uniref:MaoC/PaaZ C-terminal domain-containing protein n=1 Tax=Ottowia thiooxydans TaxID=219182 RepID=UPI00068458D1|nr:MaoC/PaaZ C-terminal domain-containing protein [Ottowia thiooxydans]